MLQSDQTREGLSRVLEVQGKRLICTQHGPCFHICYVSLTFGRLLQTAVTPFAPKLKFIDIHANPDTQPDKLAPDIGIYPINDQSQGDSKTDFSKMDLFVEFKIADIPDLFCHPDDPLHPKADDFRFENDSDDAQVVRSQLVSYAAAQAGCQFRVHIFLCSRVWNVCCKVHSLGS